MKASNQHRFRVIYGDTDMMGIVYYANYFRYFEAGRNEFLRKYEISYRALEADGYMFPVIRAEAKYHAPAKYDDELTLETTLEQLRLGSFRISYRMIRESDDTLISTGETKHACVGREGRPVRLPESFTSKFRSNGNGA